MKLILLNCAGDLKLYCHKVFSHVTLSIFESQWFECAGRCHDPLLGGIGLITICLNSISTSLFTGKKEMPDTKNENERLPSKKPSVEVQLLFNTIEIKYFVYWTICVQLLLVHSIHNITKVLKTLIVFSVVVKKLFRKVCCFQVLK